MKIVPAPAAADDSPDAARQAHRARWERIRRSIPILASGAVVVLLIAWMAGAQRLRFVAQDLTILLNLLWGVTFLVQKASEP